jgi:hypothetical protein
MPEFGSADPEALTRTSVPSARMANQRFSTPSPEAEVSVVSSA